MMEIRNLKFQPLTFHLADSKRSLHLPPRGKADIRDADVSDEIRKAERKGFVALRQKVSAKPTKTSHGETAAPVTAKGSIEGKEKKERK